MLPMVIVLALLVGLIALLTLSSFRTSRLSSRRDIVGRPPRRVMVLGLVVSIIVLFGGQWYALSSAPADVEGNALDTVVLRPKAESGDKDQVLLRAFTISDLVPGQPRLLEHLSVVVGSGDRMEVKSDGLGGLAGGTYIFSWRRHSTDCTYELSAQFDQSMGSHHTSTSSSFAWGDSVTRHFGVTRGRSSSGRFTALFPSTTYPSTILTRTLVLIDPAPNGVEETSFGELWSGPDGERIRTVLSNIDTDEPRNLAGGKAGIGKIFGTLGLFSWILLAVIGLTTAMSFRRAGLGLALFLFLAPMLLAALDYGSLVHHRGNLNHENAMVRASAMVGLRSSLLFGDSGSREVQKVITERGGVDREVALRVEAMVTKSKRVNSRNYR